MSEYPIYLDNNGTTAVDPRVAEACYPYLVEHFGNPSTRNPYGQRARAGLDKARQQLAACLGCTAAEVVFTSGATESNNWVLHGVISTWKGPGTPHVVTSRVEHPSVGKTLDFLEAQGRVQVTRVGVDAYGSVDAQDVLAALRPETVLVSLMHSNNEVGTLQPVAEVAAGLPESVAFHVDAAQSLGKVPVSLEGVTFLSLAGHKMYAPKGIGALYVRQGAQLNPLLFGAGHEGGRRSGTESVALTVAFGAACELLNPGDGERMRGMRDRLWTLLSQELGSSVSRNGHPERCLTNTLSVNFHGRTGAQVTAACPDLAASTGPACHDGVVRLSHVLSAMGVDPEVGKGAVRLSLSRTTSEDEVVRAADQLIRAYRSGE